jgi:hypothetical protein
MDKYIYKFLDKIDNFFLKLKNLFKRKKRKK